MASVSGSDVGITFAINERSGIPESSGKEKRDLDGWCKEVRNRIDPKKLYIHTKTHGYYANIPCSFDIETTSFTAGKERLACMYCFVVGVYGKVFVGRTWDDFRDMCDIIIRDFSVSPEAHLILWVHNLAYEFQFIQKRFRWAEVFALADRQPVKAQTSEGLEFRCSYRLSGYSLKYVGEHLLKYKVRKKAGDLDYDLVRSPETPLTAKEWGYVYNDGLVVMAYIQEEIERNKGKITNIPLTKTGYVRRYVRNKCLYENDGHRGKHGKYTLYRENMKALTMTEEEYKMVHEAFQGGFTHANSFYSCQTYDNVASYDFTSSYPAVMVMEKYPMGRGIPYVPTDEDDFEKKLKYYGSVFYVRIEGLEAELMGDHPISQSKCLDYDRDSMVTDNGRVVSCRYVTMCITNIDWEIIRKFYSFDAFDVGKMYIYDMDYLPKDFVKAVVSMYKDKTQLKGVEGREAEYMHRKEDLNSCYGMCVTDIVRDDYTYGNDSGWHQQSQGSMSQQIEKYNTMPNRFLAYIWGVFVTAYARRNLFTAIEECGLDYLYSDTDSVKIMFADSHKQYFDDYNSNVVSKLRKACRRQGIPIEDVMPKTVTGKVKVLGQWDYEGTYRYFRTLGAKRYLYETQDGKIHLTVSGVQKKAGEDYLIRKFGDDAGAFDAFRDDLVFPAVYWWDGKKVYEDGQKRPDKAVRFSATGKYTYLYVDEPYQAVMTDYLGNASVVSELTCAHMMPASYSLSLTDEYMSYIMGRTYER